jgi:hypothetical protein
MTAETLSIETPVSLIRDERLTNRSKVLWVWLKSQEEETGRTRFTQPELMRVLSMGSLMTLQRDVKSLENLGWLRVDRTVRPNIYRIT